MKGQRILIVEDDPLNLELARDILVAAGFLVFEARNAEEGLKAAAVLDPDLVLLDIRLPGMTGFDAMRKLRENPETTSIPVVALTAQAMEGDRDGAMQAGFVGYITKPIDTRNFVNVVRGYLEGGESRRQIGQR
jgi:CheY-like chemotaxis protein